MKDEGEHSGGWGKNKMSNEEKVPLGLPSFSGSRTRATALQPFTEGQSPLVYLQNPHPMAGTATEYELFLPSVIPINHSTLR